MRICSIQFCWRLHAIRTPWPWAFKRSKLITFSPLDKYIKVSKLFHTFQLGFRDVFGQHGINFVNFTVWALSHHHMVASAWKIFKIQNEINIMIASHCVNKCLRYLCLIWATICLLAKHRKHLRTWHQLLSRWTPHNPYQDLWWKLKSGKKSILHQENKEMCERNIDISLFPSGQVSWWPKQISKQQTRIIFI